MLRSEFKSPCFVRIGSPKLSSAAWVLCEQPPSRRRMGFSGIVIALLAVCIVFVALACAGCSSKIKGGELRHDTGAVDVKGGQQTNTAIVRSIEIRPDGSAKIELNNNFSASTQPSIVANHDNLATTQPSAETNTGNMPKIGSADEGELGSAGFTQVKKAFANAWWLGLIFIVSAAVFGYRGIRALPPSLGQIAFAVVLLACGVATILAPLAFLIGIVVLAVGAVGYYWYSEHKNVQLTAEAKDIVDNVEKGIATLPLELRSKFKAETARDMDKASKRRVSNLKNT